jgi:N-acetylglucosamine kinase-like BadF-type ATPase
VDHVLGIDVGGTQSVALAADETGRVTGEARTSGANLQTQGEAQVARALGALLDALGGEGRFAAVCLGMAGVDRPQDQQVVMGILRGLGYSRAARVANDALITLVAGIPERVGLAVLAGTGSIAFGVDPTGRVARAGGYGPVLADEGSAYWLAHQALRAALRAADGRGPETRLRGLLFEALGVSGADGLVPLVYEHGLAPSQVAALAPLVETAASGGDAVATAILDEGARGLAAAARAVARRLDFGGRPFEVVLAGGAYRACPSLAERLTACLELPGARPKRLETEPARGAVALALDLLR